MLQSASKDNGVRSTTECAVVCAARQCLAYSYDAYSQSCLTSDMLTVPQDSQQYVSSFIVYEYKGTKLIRQSSGLLVQCVLMLTFKILERQPLFLVSLPLISPSLLLLYLLTPK